MGWLIVIALIIGTGVMLGLRAITKRSFLKQRTPMPIEDLYASVKGGTSVSFDVFSEVWTTLGKAYGIDPGLIRPTDTFSELSKADSWVLGKGEDALTKWLDLKGLGRPAHLHTVLDLASWAQSATGTMTK